MTGGWGLLLFITVIAFGIGEAAIIFLLVVGAIVLAVLVFGGILAVKTIRLVGRAIGSLLGVSSRPHRPGLASPVSARCPRPRCHAENHYSARYCSRCGIAMDAAAETHRVRVRRAAMY